MRPGTKIYVARITFALIAGLLSATVTPLCMPFSIPVVIAPVAVAAVLYVASYYFVRDVIKITPSMLNEKSYMYRGGLFTYILIWLIVWTLVASLYNPSLIYPSL
ncbi:MAG: hypothetical protein DRJ68_03075 [Thermoprotei archaeon]|nr:MAG: hypothetical protein DRJ68_03075 [Thermoprotei archaeon]